MKLTPELVQKDLDGLPENYKTADVDRLIRAYIKEKADVSPLRPFILSRQQFHRIYYFVALKQIRDAEARMTFIHENLLFSDWWHTDQVIKFVADLNFERAMEFAKDYVLSEDPFIRRWGYVMFISRMCAGHGAEILRLMHNDDQYYVQMAEGWLIAEIAVREPELIFDWLPTNGLRYDINGKAIQKICDSFRISGEWKEKFKSLRSQLR